MYRLIKNIISSQKINMGGIILDQALPTSAVEMIDPFLLIHHWSDILSGGMKQNDAGVGPHPHRGFSPVTIIYKGSVHHRDSRGNDEVIYEGGVQWMHSGMGIVHSERPAKELAENGGPFELIQFWINVPAAYKMVEPVYQSGQKENIPMVISEDKKTRIAIITGELNGQKGPIETYSPMLILNIDLEAGGQVNLEIPGNYNALIYTLDGKLDINGKVVYSRNMVQFENDGNVIAFEGMEKTRILLLSGIPVNEKIASYGPFVMNNQTEIMEAIRDYQMGKMGILIE